MIVHNPVSLPAAGDRLFTSFTSSNHSCLQLGSKVLVRWNVKQHATMPVLLILICSRRTMAPSLVSSDWWRKRGYNLLYTSHPHLAYLMQDTTSNNSSKCSQVSLPPCGAMAFESGREKSGWATTAVPSRAKAALLLQWFVGALGCWFRLDSCGVPKQAVAFAIKLRLYWNTLICSVHHWAIAHASSF